MNTAHLHLVLNHLPVLGTAFGIVLLFAAILRKSPELKKVTLTVFVVVAALAIPVYLTGEPAEDIVEGLAGVSHPKIEQHEEAAVVGFTATIVLGITSLAGLIFFRKGRLIPPWFAGMVLLFSLVTAGLMARAANLGGEIRHTEIRSGISPATQAEKGVDHEKN